MRWIYLSPHLDDAVLSAGGLIYEQTQAGTPVEIWTFMCGFPPKGELSPFAQILHERWGTSNADETIRVRRAEDEKAAGIVGARAVHFDFLDCIYRRGENGEWMYLDISVQPDPREPGLPRQIAEAISARLQPDDVLVTQFGIGPHVDHLIVRAAAEMLGRRLIYAADIPYLFNFPDQLIPKTAGMKGNAQPVSEAGLRSWGDAIAAYDSQLSMLFESPEQMRQAMGQYCKENGGVRLWKVD